MRLRAGVVFAAVALAFGFASAAPTEDIAALNAKWGRPGRVVFERGEAGHPIAVLTCTTATAKVSLLGANIFSYVPAGQPDVLFAPAKMPFDTEGWHFVHGGIPLCWPWFNSWDYPGRARHGFARTSLFEVVSVAATDDVVEMVLEFKTTAETKKVWPYAATVRLRVRVYSYLDVYLSTRNDGSVPFELTNGFHSYFRVADEPKAVLKGFGGAVEDTLDPNGAGKRLEGDEIPLTPCESRVWRGTGYTVFVADPVYKRTIAISARGHKRIALWNAQTARENLAAGDGKHFICVEPVTFPHSEAWTVAPGCTQELMMSVHATRD